MELVTVRELKMHKFREQANRLKTDLIKGFENHLFEVVEEFVGQLETVEQLVGQAANVVKNREASSKVFVARQSMLSELLEISHIRTIYHIFLAILIVFMLNSLAHDFLEHGRINLDFQLMVWSFGKLSTVLMIWLYMYMSTALFMYPMFQVWAHNRTPGKKYWLDELAITGFILYQIAFIVIPLRMITDHQLPTASTVIVLCEQVRFIMKAHAFVRENLPRIIRGSQHQQINQHIPCPDFSKYLYFLFAPTLIYRDEYPRNKEPIRWNYVVSNFIQVLASLFYVYYIFEKFCVPVFRHFCNDFVTPRRMIVLVFGCMLPGTLMLFIAFFAILHSWMNAFAEMLRFADRLFYKDWWNSSSFANYYRTWNLIVHDWLYTYIYKDMCMLLGNSNRPAAIAVVFLLSAIFHEYILTVTFGFFYPVLFVMFAGAGFAFIFVPDRSNRSGNVFMWVALFIGMGILMSFYSMEWYARQTCLAHTCQASPSTWQTRSASAPWNKLTIGVDGR